MTDELIGNIVLNAPNFAALFLILFWQWKVIDKLLANQTKLLEHCLNKESDHDKTEKPTPPLSLE